MPRVVASVSDEDIRRSYYQSAPSPGMWITELDLDPLSLIVCDNDSGSYYRVGVSLDASGDGFQFSEPEEVAVRYVSAAAATPHPSIVWASAEESREGLDPAQGQPVSILAPAGAVAASTTDTAQTPAVPGVDYEALAAMTEPRLAPPADQARDALQGAQAVAAGRSVTPAQAAALMHAAAQRAKTRTDLATDTLTADTATDLDPASGTAEAAPTDAPPSTTRTPDATTATGPSHTEGASTMPVDRIKIREALGLGPDATDAEVATAYTAAYTVAPVSDQTPPAASGNSVETLNTLAALARQQGVVLMDPSQVDEMRQMAARGQIAYNEQRASKRDAVIQSAVETGRITLARMEDWRKAWDAEVVTGGDGTKTRELLESLTPNLVPMEAAGYAGTVAATETDSRLFALYPEMKADTSGGRR